MCKIIAITNQKGGVGKTTTTINLGASLGLQDKKVLIIDIDAQGNATQGLGIDKLSVERSKKTIYDLMISNNLDNISSYIIDTKFTNLDLIGSSHDFISFDAQYRGKELKELVLKKITSKIKKNYDYILIDCPPSLSTITLNGLAAADSVLIPVQSEFYALEGMAQLLNTIHICKQRINKNLRIEGIVLTMFIKNTKLCQQVYEEVSTYFKNQMFKTVIRRSISIAEAPSFGQPIMYYNKSSNGSQDYMTLGKEVIDNE